MTKRACETCGTTVLTLDPPVTFNTIEQCGAVKPGTYTANAQGGLPHCMLRPHGDGEQHMYLVEYVDRW